MLPLKHYGLIFCFFLGLFSSEIVRADNIVKGVLDKSKESIGKYRQTLHSWDSLIRGFRRGHNFGLSGCSVRTTWSSEAFQGGMDTTEGCVNFSYGYHVKLFRMLGYSLGAETEFSMLGRKDAEVLVSQPTIFQLPGITGGIIFYFSPGFRILLKSTYTLERIENLH